ncbi:MAG: hypothetical protein ACJA06_001602 [Halocynthiibacter sp.]|jgi:hypothetical protein
MKPEDSKTLRAVDQAVDDVIHDADKAQAVKAALHKRLDPEVRAKKAAPSEDAASDDADIFDNMPV